MHNLKLWGVVIFIILMFILANIDKNLPSTRERNANMRENVAQSVGNSVCDDYEWLKFPKQCESMAAVEKKKFQDKYNR